MGLEAGSGGVGGGSQAVLTGEGMRVSLTILTLGRACEAIKASKLCGLLMRTLDSMSACVVTSKYAATSQPRNVAPRQ